MATAAAAAAAITAEAEKSKSIQEQLTIPILLSDRLIQSASEAQSSKFECDDLARQATHLRKSLSAVVRFSASAQSLYDRPIRRISVDVNRTLERGLTLVRKCKKTNFLRHVFAIATTGDFRRVSNLMESSIADVKWLLSIFEADSGIVLSLPPIASIDPILAWVWSFVATLHAGSLKFRIEAAQELSSLALLNDRNKKIIVEENGVPPLLKLLKESSSPDAQIAAARALFNLADEQGRVRLIVKEMGAQVIVKLLNEAPPMRVLVELVMLVYRMVELDADVQEDFGRENVTRPLVTLLGLDVVLDEAKKAEPRKTTSLHSLVQINKEIAKNGSCHSFNYVGKKEREKEVDSPEVKMKLKVNCALALCKLAKGSLLNSRKITETKALLCLAKIIETEKGELQMICLNTVMELAAVAEDHSDLRRSAFKLNSPAAKAVLDQLLRVLNEENTELLLIPAIRAIGCLSRTFSAKETRIIEPLVMQLGHRVHEVATQAVIALAKFVSPDNFNCIDHSKAIVEYNGVPKLMNLLRANERNQLHEVMLLCYLAVHVGNDKAFEQARALSVVEGAARYVVAQNPDLRELFAKAIHNLTLYQAGASVHRQVYAQ